ncbi:MAG: hypothetical protein D6811_12340 [Alphaproteobacteria bacterium]|nr:MAG: hypothetical protein D6811_12340 [Alphaproteobacteria bacterium]
MSETGQDGSSDGDKAISKRRKRGRIGGRRPLRGLLRLALVIAVLLAANWLVDWLKHASLGMSAQAAGWMRLIVLGAMLVVYALLMAIPFVPGIEVGVAILMSRGAEAAPWVWLATSCGLTLAYFTGWRVNWRWLSSQLAELHLTRARRFVETVGPLTAEERLALLQGVLPAWLGRAILRYRYLLLALLLNMPGNGLLGGGGGIALVAGMSRLFAPLPTIVTIVIAVGWVPILVMLTGPQALHEIGTLPQAELSVRLDQAPGAQAPPAIQTR